MRAQELSINDFEENLIKSVAANAISLDDAVDKHWRMICNMINSGSCSEEEGQHRYISFCEKAYRRLRYW